MTAVNKLILLLEDVQGLAPVAQLGAVASCIGALGYSIFWAWRNGRKYVAALVETNGKLKQELKDSTARTRKIERRIEEDGRTLAILQAQVPTAVLAHAATADKAHAREILSELFDQLAPAVATCCREIATIEVALTIDAEDRPHLQRARRLAESAVLLAPEDDGGLRDLLAEINAIRAVWEDEHGVSPTANMLWNAAFDYVGGSRPDVVVPLIHRLHETGKRRYREGHYMVAAVLLGRAALLAHRNLGGEHPHTLMTRGYLAGAINAQGRSGEAEAMWRELLPVQEKVLGPEHPDTLRTRADLGWAIGAQGRCAEAEAMLRELLPVQEKVLGGKHPDTLRTRGNLAGAMNEQSRAAERTQNR